MRCGDGRSRWGWGGSARMAFGIDGRRRRMTDIVTERSGAILRVQFNRPSKKNAMTSAMYITMADLLTSAAKDDHVRVVLWHGAGDSFCAGNDRDDLLNNHPGHEDSPPSCLLNAF